MGTISSFIRIEKILKKVLKNTGLRVFFLNISPLLILALQAKIAR